MVALFRRATFLFKFAIKFFFNKKKKKYGKVDENYFNSDSRVY